MTQTNPFNTTAGDICKTALRECGAFGVGQTPQAEDISDAQARLQWMLQEWERSRWLVYHLVDLSIVSTGALSYSIGPGGDIDTEIPSGPFNNQFNSQFGNGQGTSVRPARIESAFFRQLTETYPNQIDYSLTVLQSREDYNNIALKSLQTFPQYIWYNSAWPLGQIYPWPVLQPFIYELHVSIMAQLPPSFLTLSAKLSIPFEYFNAMVTNLALRLRPKYTIPTYPGDPLPGIARGALAGIRSNNAQIAKLAMPANLISTGKYNIFSDTNY